MKPKSLIPIGFVLLIVPHITYSADFSIQPPPSSMDKYYSERGKISEWIEQMRKISKAFGATQISSDQKEWQEALEHAQAFSKAYKKASEMVPEWKDLFDLESLELFVAATQSQDIENIKTFSSKVGKTCGQCHRKHNISVWIRYHWPSTNTIKVLDPIDEQEINYDKFMHRLSSSFKNIEIFFEQDKYNESWKSIDNFSKRLRALRSACSKCHVTEWTKNSTTVKDYFVGEDMVDALQEIKKTFASGTPDKKLFLEKMEHISMESCKMCHLIHQPAAIVQRAWANTP